MDQQTFQSNIHVHEMDNLTDYALFLGGLNVTRDALLQYDPLKTGFGRLFMIRMPIFVNNKIPTKMRKFKHILEYGNTGVSGNNNIQLGEINMTGGYTGRQVDMPGIARDDVQSFTVQVYEFSGSPVREVLQYWINGMADIQSGLATYYCDGTPSDVNYGLPICEANQTAEFIYVTTDQSGKNVEYACMYANCWPRTLPLDHFDTSAGDHNTVQLNIEFAATRYISPQINEKAKQLLVKYNALMNSIHFNSGYKDSDLYPSGDNGTYYDINTGKLVAKTAAQRNTFIMT